jgi:hypothetical protein
MTQEFLRQMNLVVANATGAGFDFKDFWCTFNVRRGDFQTPNSLDARIYNVKPETANQISKLEFTTVSLSAGYPGNVGLLFEGSIVQFRQGRVDQLDSYVDITAADADEAYNFAPISTTLPANSPAGSVAARIVEAMQQASTSQNISQGYAPNFPNAPAIRGRVLFGMARDEARAFADQQNCKFSIQSGAVTYIPYTSYIPGGEVPVISVATGLIGVPEQTQAGINIRTLLNPSIKVGQLIQLNSAINQFRFSLGFKEQPGNASIALQNQLAPNTSTSNNPSDQQGLYYVMVANHVGDTRGQNWYTDLTCLAVDATLTDQKQANALSVKVGPIARYGGT